MENKYEEWYLAPLDCVPNLCLAQLRNPKCPVFGRLRCKKPETCSHSNVTPCLTANEHLANFTTEFNSLQSEQLLCV